MTSHIVLLRHGHSLANEQRLIASRPENAADAFGLTPLGREQVRTSLARAVSRGSLARPGLLICSPLLRARESAEVAAELLGAGPSADARLTERDFGELELEPDRRYDEVWEEDRRDPTHRRWGVESVADVLERAGALVEELTREARSATVVLCTHGDVASVLLCASHGAPLGRHREVGALRTGDLRSLPSVELVLDALRSWGAARGREHEIPTDAKRLDLG